jgi:hypothetical protein
MLDNEQTVQPYSPTQALPKSIRESDLSAEILEKCDESAL